MHFSQFDSHALKIDAISRPKVTTDQLNHSNTVASVRAMGASKISASRINVSLSYRMDDDARDP
jgi:hypothetical protein